jgi:hypothetical protein
MASFADDFLKEAKAKKPDGTAQRRAPVMRVTQGWQYLLSYYDDAITLTTTKKPAWQLSAMLVPIGRGSTVADLTRLDQMVAALGVPADALVTPKNVTPPGGKSHHWVWLEGGAEAPEEWKAMWRDMVGTVRRAGM